MKYVYALLCLLLLVACAPQYAPRQPVVYQPPPAAYPPQYPPGYPQQVYTAPPQAAPAVSYDQGGLGATQITWHPNTIDTTQAASARPFTPGVLKIEVKRKASTSPPITEGATILVTAIYPDGTYENFGTSDIEGIVPRNVLAFDFSPSVQAYTNTNAEAKGNINTRVQYVAFVKYGEQSRVFGTIVNVR